MRTNFFLLLFLSLAFFHNTSAQNACTCCTEAHKAFDFWVGDWTVVDTSGNKVGDNTLTKIESNCVLQESWRGAQGVTGTSINFYEKADSTWNQVWIDSQGNILRLKGNLVDDRMVLLSEMTEAKGKQYYNQVSWIPNDDGTVKQVWEVYDAKDQLLQTLFIGIYHRKE